MRQLIRVLAVIMAYGCAIFAGRAVLPVARTLFVKMPDPLLTILGGVVLGFLAYAILTSIGTILFKRTGQYESRTIRLMLGSGGAFLGIFFGLLFVWLVFSSVRLIGSVAQAQVVSRDALTSATMQPVWNRPLQIKGRPRISEDERGALISTLAQMKGSLENGTLGNVVKNTDPMPPARYRTLEKLGAVASNVESAQRFLAFPGAQEIGTHPKIVALRNDPEITDLVAHGRVFELLQNQRIIDAANDAGLRERISKFDLERALDYALRKN